MKSETAKEGVGNQGRKVARDAHKSVMFAQYHLQHVHGHILFNDEGDFKCCGRLISKDKDKIIKSLLA